MAARELLTIQKTNVVLGIAATAASGLVWGGRGMIAAGAGAFLATANFWALRRLGARAVAKVADGTSAAQGLILVGALAAKMAVLFGLVWLAVRRLGLPVLPFTAGLSVFVVSIFLMGFTTRTSEPETAPAGEG